MSTFTLELQYLFKLSSLPQGHQTTTAKQSRFFKQHYQSDWHNRVIMTREIDVICSQKGW